MIKNLLFDLGGVIMDIRRLNCVASFERLGMKNADSFLGEYSQKGPFLQLEEGAISEEEFRTAVRALIDGEVSDEQIDSAFCDFLVGIPKYRLEQLRQLKKSYNIYMLSNTNSIMWRTRIAEDFRQEGLEREDYFDGIVTSFEARSIKPDAKIFHTVVEKLGINPDETLFLDDSQKNLDAATQLGFHTLLVTPGSEFFELLKSM
ncbi:MAG: HAD family phosphatase [Muribaculaceae bacterium]|nr:HAD family phosphatase [Muribaculaceae bacterium]